MPLVRRRALLELGVVAAALLGTAALEVRRGQLDLATVGLAVALAGPAFARLLALRGRLAPAASGTVWLELAAVAALALLGGSSAWPFVLVGLATVLRPIETGGADEPARPLERAAALLLVLVPVGLWLALHFETWRLDALCGPIVLAGALALDALAPGSERSVSAAARRASTAALGAASAILAAYEPARGGFCPATALLALATVATVRSAGLLPPSSRTLGALALLGSVLVFRARVDLELALEVLAAVAFGVLPVDALPGRARPLALAAILGLALALPLDAVPLPIVGSFGLAAGAAAVFALATLAFFAVAIGWQPTGRPKKPALVAAMAVALAFALEGGLRVRQRDRFDIALSAVVPLTVSGSKTFAEGAGPREDLRARPFSPRKAEGVFRVVVLGGSTAWGHAQKERAASYAGQLEARAPQLGGKRAEVVCLAFPGGASDQELAVLGVHALAWQPDLVLAVDGYNDVAFLSGKETYPGDFYSWPQHRVGLDSPLIRGLVRRSAALGPLGARLATIPAASVPARFRPGSTNGFYLEGFATNEEAMAVLAREGGARFAWGFVPLLEDRAARVPGEPEIPEHAPEAIRRRAEAVARTSPLVLRQGGVVLDLVARVVARSAQAPSEPWFVDECHYTDRGMTVLAEETWAALVEARAVPP